MLTDSAHPSLNSRDLEVILSRRQVYRSRVAVGEDHLQTGYCFCPNYSLPPNSSSNLKCMYAKLRLDTMETTTYIESSQASRCCNSTCQTIRWPNTGTTKALIASNRNDLPVPPTPLTNIRSFVLLLVKEMTSRRQRYVSDRHSASLLLLLDSADCIN